MSQLPMKVSEAVFELRDEVETGTMPREVFEAIKTLLASHEALRLAGKSVVQYPLEYSGVHDHGLVALSENEYRALSCAVEEANR